MAQQAIVGQGLLVIDSRSHVLRHATHPVWLLWTSDQPVAEFYTWQRPTLALRDKHPCPRYDSNTQSPQTQVLDHVASGITIYFAQQNVNIHDYLLTYSMEQSPSWEVNWFCS